MWQKFRSTNDNVQQFTVHIPGVHQDRNDAQVQAGHHWLPPRPLPVIRQPSHQPITSQHTNDVTHSYNPRSEYFTLLRHYSDIYPTFFDRFIGSFTLQCLGMVNEEKWGFIIIYIELYLIIY